MYIDFKSIISLLLAVATVYTFIKAMRLEFILEPIKELWDQLDRCARPIVACAVALLAIMVVSKDGTNALDSADGSETSNVGIITNTIDQLDLDSSDSNVVNRIMSVLRSATASSSRTIPNWYATLGYSTTDTDGDGIPDTWEKWTRTNPGVDDFNLDPDGDGVCNYDEFLNQCDPMCSDTDADGYSDLVEINGILMGKSWFNPLVRASYDYIEPDVNCNSVPDRWEGSGYPYGHVDTNGDGLTDNVLFPQTQNNNFDVLVMITTTRPALLTWEDCTGYVVQPCTNLEIRLRLTVEDFTDVKLLGALPCDGAEGLWYCKMDISWPTGRVQETERNRVRLADGTTVDCEIMNTEFRGEIDTAQSALSCRFVRKWLNFNGWNCACWEHCAWDVIGHVDYTNVVPPFTWYVNGNELASTTNTDYITAGLVYDHWNGNLPITVTCRASETNECARLPIEASCMVGIDHCPPSVTNIIGAAWEPNSHTNASDHLPRPKEEHRYRFSDYCPWTYEVTYCVGWDHAKVNTRNLPVIATGDDWNDKTDHCIALEWTPRMTIDLSEYLTSDSQEVIDLLRFNVNGEPKGYIFTVDGTAKQRSPIILHVEVSNESLVSLDSIWFVLHLGYDRNSFDTWYANQSNDLAWTNSLPLPCRSLTINNGAIVAGSSATGTWSAPDPHVSSTYMHHNALYEMRTHSASVSGNQATFDTDLNLIKSGITAGTADRFAPYNRRGGLRYGFDHRDNDVRPYILSLQLDGNPVLPPWDYIPTRFVRPCIYQGANANRYLLCRPTVY